MSEEKNFIGFLVWEGDKIPIGWIDILLDERLNQIWVPSYHTKEAVMNTIADWTILNPTEVMPTEVLEKLKVVPHGVDSDIFFPLDKDDKKEVFTFITNKGFTGMNDRGGVQYLLKAYLEEFTSKDNVQLLVKINPAYGVPDMEEIYKELDIQNKDKPLIHINSENIPYKNLNNFYNSGDVFVVPSRADGFMLGGIEAMACGLPVISTDFGGQTDYIKENNNGYLIGGLLEYVKHDVMYESIKWLTPDIEALKKCMRMVYENKKIVEDMKDNCLQTAEQFSWKNSAKEAIKNLILLKNK